MDLWFLARSMQRQKHRTEVIHSIVIIELGCVNDWVIPALSAADKNRRETPALEMFQCLP